MLSISSSAKGDGAAGYYFNSATEEDYVGKEQSAGYWSGKGAAALDLEGGVTRKEFVNLLQGFSPDGKEKLVQNAGHPNRQCGWDLTNSSVKSFSVLYGLS